MRDWPVMKRFLSGALAIAFGPSSTAAYADDLASVRLRVNKLGATTSIWVVQQNGLFRKYRL
jgi:hypothetical protein